MAKILCVEDSPEFFIYLTSVLKEHVLVQAPTIGDALKLAQTGRDSFELILLDIELPDGNGVKALPELQAAFAGKLIPVIILSADDDVLSKVAAFGIGANDYVSKPPDANELRARIEARLRDAKMYREQKHQIAIGDLVIDLDRITVEHASAAKGRVLVDLTPTEFKILKLLSGREGQVFSRDQLIDNIWGAGKFMDPRTIDAHVSHLRKKIAESNVNIETVLTAGYRASVKG